MSAPRLYTEREVVLRERVAFVEGDRFGATAATRGSVVHPRVRAAELYPLPKVERPRKLSDATHDFRIVGNVIQCRSRFLGPHEVADWYDCRWGITPEMVKLLAPLVESPTELVPDDGSEPEGGAS